MNTTKDPMENVERKDMIKRMKSEGLNTDDIESLENQRCTIFSSTAFFRFNHLFKTYEDWTNRQNEGDAKYRVHTFNYLDPPEGFLDMEER